MVKISCILSLGIYFSKQSLSVTEISLLIKEKYLVKWTDYELIYNVSPNDRLIKLEGDKFS